MTARLLSLACVPIVLARLDLDGWLVGPEVRSGLASFFAALISAIANIFVAGFFGGV